ncbi:hypothetical protein [Nocardioides litoris]|uniref:hypothetical protein n=1 Tax=Nocardioides litoris TaxID=1926648 RepID=UPI00111FA39E|nr:hypothetical protein [Nocardioides litoris]
MTRRRAWMAGLTVLVLLGVAVAVVLVRSRGDDPRLVAALRSAPDDSARLLWTDWSGVRAEVGADLDVASSPQQVESMLDDAFDADLTSTSALVESAALMQQRLGFSPATLDWEVYAQSESAASLTMRLAEGVTTDDVAEALRAVEFVAPDEPDGVWTRNVDTSPVAADLTPELGNIVLDDETGTVLASDTADGVRRALEALRADEPGDVPGDVLASLGPALSAAAYTGADACGALAMTSADADAQAEADRLVAAAGPVDPVTGFAIGALSDGTVRVALGFDDDDEARANADSRAALASGPAPGQGGEFADRFTLRRASAEGEVVTLALDPVDDATVLSDLSTGPVLFATC